MNIKSKFLNKLEDNIIFPYVSFISDNSFYLLTFRFFYNILAISQVCIAIYHFSDVIRTIIDYNRLIYQSNRPDLSIILYKIFTFLVISFLSLIGYKFWIYSKSLIEKSIAHNSPFVVSSLLALFIKKIGEFFGPYIIISSTTLYTWVAVQNYLWSLNSSVSYIDELPTFILQLSQFIAVKISSDFISYYLAIEHFIAYLIIIIFGFLVLITTRLTYERITSRILTLTKKIN